MGMTTRREFLASAVGTAANFTVGTAWAREATTPYDLVAATDRPRILAAANRYLSEQPITVTSSHSERSKGGPHDYFSEGDYWWPDEKNPNGPYVRRRLHQSCELRRSPQGNGPSQPHSSGAGSGMGADRR